MKSKPTKPVIFLSHFAHEATVASALKRFIEDTFADAVEVFVSSNRVSLQAGDPWEKIIRQKLHQSSLVLSLLSLDSLQRPWIYFESGAAWFKQATIIPILHRGLTIGELPQQFQRLNAIYLQKPDGISRLMSTVEKIYSLRRDVPYVTCVAFAKETAALGHHIDVNMQQYENLPNVSFTLYSKTRAQDGANRAEAGSNLVSNFRKPSLAQVFSALLQNGQLYTNIVSIDEYWVSCLVESGRLERISNHVSRFILEELLQYPHGDGKVWTLPHFLDFSYYAVKRGDASRLTSALQSLLQADDETYSPALARLKEHAGAGSPHLLAYDFKTRDTVASVIVEFIESIGAGLSSLESEKDFVDFRNIRALRILRDLVGRRPSEDFQLGRPLNLDTECHHAAFLRQWHSMASDEDETRITHIPIFDNPIRGTLGGWHLGMLAHPPFSLEGQMALDGCVKPEAQQERFESGAGLPTLAAFYHDPTKSCQTDWILNWPLKRIREYVRKLIKRSNLDNFHHIRDPLAQLHLELMREYEEPVECILRRCIKNDRWY